MGDDRAVRLSSAFEVAEFRALWLADLLSSCGDQIARVALSVVVYQRTGSAILAGLTYALTYAPSFLGGIVLAGLADHFPRREVMASLDLIRAVLIGLVAIPGIPLGATWALIAAVSFVSPPFKAAQLALLSDVLDKRRYLAGLSIRSITNQSAQLAGFAGGGLLLTLVGPSYGLAIDSLSFVASAAFVRFGVHRRPAAADASARQSFVGSSITGAKLAFADRGARVLLGMIWLVGLIPTYEGLAAPYSAALGGGTVAVGLLLASDPCGSVVGSFLFGRLRPAWQVRSLGPLTVLTGIPLVLCLIHPGLVVSMVVFAVSGAFGTIVVIKATDELSQRTPDTHRGMIMGLSNTGLTTTMGISPLIGGAVADQTSPALAVAWFGIGGIVLAVPLAIGWHAARRRALTPEPEPATTSSRR